MDENTALRRKHLATCQSLFSSEPCMAHYTPLPQKRVFIEVRQISKTLAALERKKQDDEACGEIETAHPGYLGSQDTFYVGTLISTECTTTRFLFLCA